MPTEIIAALIFAALLMLFLVPNFIHIKPNEAIVIERLGSFLKVIDQPGVIFLIPLVDRVIQRENLLPQTRELTIIKDNNSCVYMVTYAVVDIKMFCYAATESSRHMEDIIKKSILEDQHHSQNLNEELLNIGIKLIKLQPNK